MTTKEKLDWRLFCPFLSCYAHRRDCQHFSTKVYPYKIYVVSLIKQFVNKTLLTTTTATTSTPRRWINKARNMKEYNTT